MTESLSAIATRVDTLSEKVLAILKAARQNDLARRMIEQETRERSTESTVVIAGEVNRGKSSIVNALVGQPGLSPVDFETTTNVHLMFRHSKKPYVRLYTALEPEGRAIDPDSISEWTTESANPGNYKMVSAVEIGCKNELLAKNLVLLDTPGTGGVQAGHVEVTLAALGRADALIFVTDGASPIASTELNFLVRAAQSIGTIIFVLTKTDISRGWKELLEANRTIIQRYTPQFASAPYLPLSSKLEVKARALATAGDQESLELAEELRIESGFEELRKVIREQVIAKAKMLRDANRLQLIKFCLSSLEVPERTAVSVLRGDPGLKESLEADRQRLENLRKESSTWIVALNDQTQEMRQVLSKETSRLLGELRKKYDDQIKTGPSEFFAVLPQHLAADFQAVAARLEAAFDKEWDGLLLRLSESLSESQENLSLSALGGGPIQLSAPDKIESGGRSKADAATLLGGATSAFFGMSMTHTLLGGIAVMAPFLTLAGGIGAVLVGTVTVLARRKVQKQQEAKAVVASAMGDSSAQLRAEVETKILRASRSVRTELTSLLESRSEDVKAALAKTQSLLAADQSRQQNMRVTAENRLKHLQALRREADQCLLGLREAE